MNARTAAKYFLSLTVCLLTPHLGTAQSFTGSNAPGGATNFSFSISASATNLSFTLPGSATAYSYLLIRRGATPTDTVYDFSSQVAGTNAIHLELPEAAPGTYHCRVRTPAASTGHAFTLTVASNLSDLRTAQKPVTKLLTNGVPTLGVATMSSRHYFRVELRTNSGWQVRVETTNSTQPHVYVRSGQIPSESIFNKASLSATNDSLAILPKDTTPGANYIGLFASGLAQPQNYRLMLEPLNIRTLTWDPGLTHEGTAGFSITNSPAGDYYFRITTDNPSLQAWRTALRVTTGEADVFLMKDDLPVPAVVPVDQKSDRAGSDGFVLPASKFSFNQDWFILVKATEGARWTLVSGTPYVTPNLPIVAANDAGTGGDFEVGPEGIRYFSSTVPTDSLAWRLWLNGSNNVILLRQSRVPLSASSENELAQIGQMLVVPPYLVGGGQYFIGVVGAPLSHIRLDSRQQRVDDLSYDSTITGNVTGYGYVTYKVEVPSNSIIWQLTLSSTNGNPNLAVRRGFVPNEGNSDAYSDLGAGLTDQVTLVPPPQTGQPGLSGGSFYVTVYGSNAFHFRLENNPAVVTDIHYVDTVTNDQPARVGWRYFRVGNILEQQSSLGWDLLLTNFTPHTRIALRRTKAPSLWTDRRQTPPALPITSTRNYYDYLSASDFLQRPGHEAEVWYIGVYNPSNALGNFTLITRQLQTSPLTDNQPVVRTNIPAGRWDFYSISVPANLLSPTGDPILGWDVRLTNVTNGLPLLVIRRDSVPTNNVRTTLTLTPPGDTNWPSLRQWAATADWTKRQFSFEGTNEDGRILAMGVGRPLEPGNYFIGVLDDRPASTNRLGYTLVSRWIGTNQAIPVKDLAWNGGSITNTVAPREADYYRVVVPPGVTSWKARLRLFSGEAMLVVMTNTLPHVLSEKRVQKVDQEQYLRLPEPGNTSLLPGTNYLVVIGEGQSPPAVTRIGPATTTYAIDSQGPLPVIELGTVGASDLVFTTNVLEGGASHGFHFRSPTAKGFWLMMEDHSGLPAMVGLIGNALPDPGYSSDFYGNDGGGTSGTKGPTSLITGLGPIDNYSVMVKARGTGAGAGANYPDASYTVRVREINPITVPFDGGGFSVSDADGSLGQFFYIDVPSGALGWDLRLENVTGNPALYVRRGDYLAHDAIPSFPLNGTTWDQQDQFNVGFDWTGRPFSAAGVSEWGRVFTVGMGRPLQPGRYCVGVFGTGPMSFTLVSRGIGPGFTIPVQPLAFAGGTVQTNLPAREVAYYAVTIPPNTASWKVKLGTNIGEACLVVLKDALPNITATDTASATSSLSPGRQMKKIGDEQFLLLPSAGQNYLPAGTYYLAAISEGANAAAPDEVGVAPSQFTITSWGESTVQDLGEVGEIGAGDITVSRSLEAGEVKLYRFSVPPGTLNLEARIEGTNGFPVITLVGGSRPPNPSAAGSGVAGEDPAGYGTDGGESPGTYVTASLVNVANPTNTFTLAVKARGVGMVFSNASYTLRLNSSKALFVSFNGGSGEVTNQAANTWRHFRVVVPTNILGWDLRLINVTTGMPRMVICREALPATLATTLFTPGSAVNWPTNAQWYPGFDWTQRPKALDGTDETGRVLAMGMRSPLEPGTYYIGVRNPPTSTAPMSYTLLSRGIGAGQAIPVEDLPFLGSATNLAMPPREAAYYRVVVPSNAPSWKLRLAPTGGESMMVIRNGSLPNIDNNLASAGIGAGKKMQKAGHEHFVFLPSSGLTNLPPGTNYIAVVSEGINPSAGNPTAGNVGNGVSGFVLRSELLNVIPMGLLTSEDLTRPNEDLEGGETKAYQFDVPNGTVGMKLFLEGREGNPVMIARQGAILPKPEVALPGGSVDAYGNEGGQLGGEAQTNLLTIPNPVAGTYSVLVKARGSSSPQFDAANARYTLRAQEILVPQINFGNHENTNGLSHAVAGQLQDNERAFFKVIIPESTTEQPIIGWRLNLIATNGTAVMRVRPNALPSDADASILMTFATNTAVIAPPFLTNGTWYIEVKGVGAPGFTLSSSPLQLERPKWVMPEPGETNVAPGLVWPIFGDTGIDTNGAALPGSQGLFLPHGSLHYYAVEVSPNNIGLLRAELKAISGNPDLYVRAGSVPTLSHKTNGAPGTTYDREMSTPGVTEYANWVPLDGRTEVRLAPGLWYLAVQAGGNVNAEYRLSLSAGFVTDLPFDGPGLVAQSSAVEDWRYFRVNVPATVPFDFNLTFSQLQGGVAVYVRDTVPPGNGRSGVAADLRDWQTDLKNGPSASYPRYTTVGNFLLSVPLLRSGKTYYIGVRALSGNPTFDLSVSTNGTVGIEPQTIAFDGGYVDTYIPPGGQLLYRIDVPDNATRWKHLATHVLGVKLFIEQGAAAIPSTSSADWYSTSANNSLDRLLVGAWNTNTVNYDRNTWPWVPGESYYLLVTNSTMATERFVINMGGKDVNTDDNDADSLPDIWEYRYFGNFTSQRGTNDFDGDAVSNIDEFTDGTNPTDNRSFWARLVVGISLGRGTIQTEPAMPRYPLGSVVVVTPIPEGGASFVGWTGHTNGLITPLEITMTGHVTNYAMFKLAGDDFSSALLLSGLNATVFGTNVGMSKEPGEPMHAGNPGGKSIWWRWTAPASSLVELSTAGSSFNTLLGVYTGSSVASLTRIASDNNSLGGTNRSHVIFPATAGTTYYFAVDGYNGASSRITLTLGNGGVMCEPCRFAYAEPQGDGRYRWAISGTPDCTYQISWSSNLVDWTIIGPVTMGSNGTQWFMDPDSTGHSTRFYRGQSE